jgi:Mg2+ and Co2+ transporter CorA
LLLADARNGLDFTVAQRAEVQSEKTYEMARSAHRLNVLAALFFPVTAISSVFGMNFASGLEKLSEPWLFWIVLMFGFMCGGILVKVICKPELH